MKVWNKKRKPKHHTKLYWTLIGDWKGIVKNMKNLEVRFIINRTSNLNYKALKKDRRRRWKIKNLKI